MYKGSFYPYIGDPLPNSPIRPSTNRQLEYERLRQENQNWWRQKNNQAMDWFFEEFYPKSDLLLPDWFDADKWTKKIVVPTGECGADWSRY